MTYSFEFRCPGVEAGSEEAERELVKLKVGAESRGLEYRCDESDGIRRADQSMSGITDWMFTAGYRAGIR